MSTTSKRVLCLARLDEVTFSDVLTLAREVEQLEGRLAEARDCGQAVVCATPPGCQRHWAERNTELVRERERAERKLAAIRALADHWAHECWSMPYCGRQLLAILDDDKGET